MYSKYFLKNIFKNNHRGFYRRNISVGIWQWLPQSPMILQTDILGRYFTFTDNFTNGLNPSVFGSTSHNDRRMYRRISSVGISNTHRQLYRRYVSISMSQYHRQDKSVSIFQAGTFFLRAISVCKTISKCFFLFFRPI